MKIYKDHEISFREYFKSDIKFFLIVLYNFY